MDIIMVLTSHGQLGNTGQKTGFSLEEFATPYYIFKDAGAAVTLASPRGGHPPVAPKSDASEFRCEAIIRFKSDSEAQAQMAQTRKLSDISPDDYAAAFYPGGHGPLWDLTLDRDSITLIETLFVSGKPVAAICHAPAVLLNANALDGSPLVQGKSVTGFSNSEEASLQLADALPFLLEDALKAKGAQYSKAGDWHSHVVIDGNLLTGQNPESSAPLAKALLALIKP